MKERDNIYWRISKLEAKAGIPPAIGVCERMMPESENDGSVADIPQDMLTAIDQLKNEKIQKKLHHLKGEVTKALKKSRTFEIQKLVKRIKLLNDKQDPSVEKLCKSLEDLKSVSLEPIACRIMELFPTSHSPNISEAINLDSISYSELPTSSSVFLKSKVFNKSISSIWTNWRVFLEKLLAVHQRPPVVKRNAKLAPKGHSVIANAGATIPKSPAKATSYIIKKGDDDIFSDNLRNELPKIIPQAEDNELPAKRSRSDYVHPARRKMLHEAQQKENVKKPNFVKKKLNPNMKDVFEENAMPKKREAVQKTPFKKSNDISKLHPSWQAKILQGSKERSLPAFQGTKIKFDD